MLFKSKKAGKVKLAISRGYLKVLLLPCLFVALGANAANSGSRDQTLVPPPPPIAIDLGGGLSSGIDYSGVNMYPGTFSRFSNIYSGYSNGYPSAASSISSVTAAQNSMAEAMRQYTKAFDIDLNSSDALKQRGLYRYAMGDLVGANSDLNKALTISPHDRQAAEALLDLWRRQVAANPLAVNGHLGLARAYLQTGDLESAQSEYRVVVKLDPNNPHLPAARKCVKQALARRAAQKSFETAKTLEGVGDYKEAYEKAAEALSYCPNSTHVMLLKAQLAEKLQDYPEARKMYLAVLSEDPKNQEATKALKSLKTPKVLHTSTSVSAEKNNSKEAAEVASSNIPNAIAAANGGLRPALVPPAPTADEVSSLSNFLGSVRTLAIAQKNQTKKVEKVTQKSLKSLSLQNGASANRIARASSESAPALKAETAQMAPVDAIAPTAVAEMPQLAPPISVKRQTGSSNNAVSPNAEVGAPVRMELEKVALSGSGVTLSVLLRNNGDRPLVLPQQVKVAIKAPGKPERLVKGHFLSSTVVPQGAVKGTIKLPENEFSPSTDVFLPDFRINGFAQSDLHLSIPLASL